MAEVNTPTIKTEAQLKVQPPKNYINVQAETHINKKVAQVLVSISPKIKIGPNLLSDLIRKIQPEVARDFASTKDRNPANMAAKILEKMLEKTPKILAELNNLAPKLNTLREIATKLQSPIDLGQILHNFEDLKQTYLPKANKDNSPKPQVLNLNSTPDLSQVKPFDSFSVKVTANLGEFCAWIAEKNLIDGISQKIAEAINLEQGLLSHE